MKQATRKADPITTCCGAHSGRINRPQTTLAMPYRVSPRGVHLHPGGFELVRHLQVRGHELLNQESDVGQLPRVRVVHHELEQDRPCARVEEPACSIHAQVSKPSTQSTTTCNLPMCDKRGGGNSNRSHTWRHKSTGAPGMGVVNGHISEHIHVLIPNRHPHV